MKKLSALMLSAATYASLAVPAFADHTPAHRAQEKAAAEAAAAAAKGISVNPCPKGDKNMFAKLCDNDIFSFTNILGNVFTLIFVIAVLIALGFLIFGGLKWITSGGDKSGVEGARNMIVASLVGLVIIFLSYFILDIVLKFFTGSGIQNLQLPTL